MSNVRLPVGQALAGIAVVLALLNDAGETAALGLPLMADSISALFLALAASFVTLEKGSSLIAGLLMVQGVANSYAAYAEGATIGIYFGLVVFALGVAKLGVTFWARSRRGPGSSLDAPGVGSKRAGVSRSVAVVAMIVVVAIAAGTVLLATASPGPSTSSSCPAATGQESPSTILISIYNGAANSANPPGYTPDSITLVIGVNNTVTWTNNDSAHHTVTSTSAPACGSFDSGNLNQGDTYTHTFTVPGTYEYHCSYHSWMIGTIIVKAGS